MIDLSTRAGDRKILPKKAIYQVPRKVIALSEKTRLFIYFRKYMLAKILVMVYYLKVCMKI